MAWQHNWTYALIRIIPLITCVWIHHHCWIQHYWLHKSNMNLRKPSRLSTQISTTGATGGRQNGERERTDASSGLVALFNRTQGVLCKVAKDHERQKSRQNQSSATLAQLHRLETGPDGKWTCGKQLDKFRGHFFAFASSWTKVARADKLKGRQ
jgi:hypothetical protein